MAGKRTTKRVENSTKTVRGRPFAKGHPHRWKRGWASPNPGGRPKSRHFSEACRAWLRAKAEGRPTKTNAEQLIEIIGKAALKGDVAAATTLVDYAEGKPRKLTERERMVRLYESAVEGLITSMRDRFNQSLSRADAIAHLANYYPDIVDFIPSSGEPTPKKPEAFAGVQFAELTAILTDDDR